MVYPKYFKQRSRAGFESPPDVVLPGKNRESSEENHDKRTLDQRVGNGVYNLSRITHDYEG